MCRYCDPAIRETELVTHDRSLVPVLRRNGVYIRFRDWETGTEFKTRLLFEMSFCPFCGRALRDERKRY